MQYELTDRQNKMLAILDECKEIDIPSLAGMLEVSQASVRKDLTALEGRHLLKREHGIAMQIEKLHRNVTIITNSLFIASYIRPALNTHVILLGGAVGMDALVTGGLMVRWDINGVIDRTGFSPD